MSIFDSLVKTVLNRLIKEGLDRIFRRKPDDKNSEKKHDEKSDPKTDRNHPWRLCPTGESWVRTHPLTVPASGKGPEYETTRHWHCRVNSNKSEIYTADELREIAEQFFDGLLSDSEAMPVPDDLGFPNGNKYDRLIAGWTKFWNEVFKPESPVTPDFIKALVAKESNFELPKDQQSSDGLARGLIQVTENTRKILQNPKGELRDHYIEMTPAESREPAINIGAGVRWLHYKKRFAERRLIRKITWEEAAAEYKGIFRDLKTDKRSKEIMEDLRMYYTRLKRQRR